MTNNLYIYTLISALVTYLIRVLPLTIIKKEITNTTIRSFLYYVPYVTLSVMTFPAIITATSSIISGVAGFVSCIICAYKTGNLFKVSLCGCSCVFITELMLNLLL